MMESSPALMRSSMSRTSSSPIVSTPGAMCMGWIQKGGQGREVSAKSGSIVAV
jgi:hypothetical protein